MTRPTTRIKKRSRRNMGVWLFLALPHVCRGFQAAPLMVAHSLATRIHSTSISSSSNISKRMPIFMSSEVKDDHGDRTHPRPNGDDSSSSPPSTKTPPQGLEPAEESFFSNIANKLRFVNNKWPPIRVDDFNVLFYDIVLIINLSVSISFWAVHRMDPTFIGTAVSEGCLMSILWIAAGLYTGAFLYSAVDGHYGSADERGGPKAAALLGFQTFLNAVNLRLVFSLLVAVLEHRPVGSAPGEMLLPLEIGFGLILMCAWRGLHSFATPRL